MSDPSASASGSAPAESPAQEKARLRRERRAAKIADGESRLRAITALQGGSHRDVAKDVPGTTTVISLFVHAGAPPAWLTVILFANRLPVKPTEDAAPQPRPTAAGTATPDPDEVDISEHHYTPASQPRLPSPFAYERTATPSFNTGQSTPDPSQDPMMAMLQQMLGSGAGGMPGVPGQPNGQPGDIPPGLANIFSALQGEPEPEPSPDQSSAWVWRLVHAVFSLALAIYIVFRTPFTGSKLSRDSLSKDEWAADSTPAESFAHFFHLFATFEVVLQTSRYFIERGQLQGGGILSSIAKFLPEQYAWYVRVLGRYSVIWSTVVSDAMVVVFVLGAASWWKGGAIA